MKYFVLLISFIFLNACSVKKAGVPTAPPETENKVFNSASMIGEFCHSDTPKVFLWPTMIEGEPMTYDQKVVSRQKINQYNDELAEFSDQRDSVKAQIDKKFLGKIRNSKSEFKQMKCYSYCDPDVAFFCDQSDDSVTEIADGEWIEGENRPQKGKIRMCKNNQSERKVLQADCKDEYEKKYDPLNAKAGDAALALLREVGNANYFTDFSEVTYTNKDGKIFISLKYADITYSTEATSDLLKIRDVNLDMGNGYLSFILNAIDTEDDNRIYGEFFFDLEFIFTDSGFRWDGDFRLMDFDRGTERIGRVSMPFSREACEKTAVITRCE